MIGKIWLMDSKNINKINRFLIILLSLIFLCIILVSLFYFLTSSSNNQNKYRKIDNPTEIKNSVVYSVFSDFGRLRTFTLDNPQIPIVINPFLSYKTVNTFLYE